MISPSSIRQIPGRLAGVNSQHDPKPLIHLSHSRKTLLEVINRGGKGSRLLTRAHGFSPERRQLPDFSGPNHIMRDNEQICHDQDRSQDQELAHEFPWKTKP
jgi:hypothetical protein